MTLNIETKRLFLKPLSMNDIDSMVIAIMSDKDVMKWLSNSNCVSTTEEQYNLALEYLKGFTEPWNKLGFGVWGLFYKETSSKSSYKFIGYCGFIPEKIPGTGPEIAYGLKKVMWGKGLIHEALNACLTWLFNKHEVPSVYAVTDINNVASQRVMEKVGMKYIKDVDLYDSVANGEGLLPFYSIDRNIFFNNAPKMN
ncbi:MAG: GNAT family N-acetyltransferase [Desulfobacterales bacterium]|nr:GNAT family N-acetyltransferase [Desulfobacterales bacterium]MCP4161479.1 GNAT family N-acetyltransferase [Deltaproteobacteria bacterium]